jgi:hypothetical protein
LKDSGIRYRMTDPRAMPKFGSDKNRFRTAAKSSPAEGISPPSVTLVSCPDHQDQVSDLSQCEPARAGEPVSATCSPLPARRDEERESASSGVGVARRIGLASAAGLRSARVILLAAAARLAKVNLLKARGPSRPAKADLGPFTKAPVQGELSLDRIRVVRNDLSDADLEVVPARSKPAEAIVETALQT